MSSEVAAAWVVANWGKLILAGAGSFIGWKVKQDYAEKEERLKNIESKHEHLKDDHNDTKHKLGLKEVEIATLKDLFERHLQHQDEASRRTEQNVSEINSNVQDIKMSVLELKTRFDTDIPNIKEDVKEIQNQQKEK